MTNPPSNKTLGVITFSQCGSQGRELFRVNPGVPMLEAMEHASLLLYCAKALSLDAALESDGERYAWASHYLGEMGKAVIDDLTQGMLRGASV
ncbi:MULTISPECIES: DUF3077 domain-containing protein [Pseudomonas]|jgi:hypothetical protein|uniref:DUF3077 domain-containing protein n=1 Tax=Pseudomonas gingeri TaxID=117681 RepID=A0A7Y7WH25_9PSED|nr:MULTISPECIES: DUF3077 domain-containing protein [Pseudomonas]MCU1741695.1 DUF3077 domain-containing protein [Pseudomonas sp. 20S_6.2_Bac1]NWB49204.1 DUF3077 domain-containing protein [Pseudomonas gingeri]